MISETHTSYNEKYRTYVHFLIIAFLTQITILYMLWYNSANQVCCTLLFTNTMYPCHWNLRARVCSAWQDVFSACPVTWDLCQAALLPWAVQEQAYTSQQTKYELSSQRVGSIWVRSIPLYPTTNRKVHGMTAMKILWKSCEKVFSRGFMVCYSSGAVDRRYTLLLWCKLCCSHQNRSLCRIQLITIVLDIVENLREQRFIISKWYWHDFSPIGTKNTLQHLILLDELRSRKQVQSASTPQKMSH